MKMSDLSQVTVYSDSSDIYKVSSRIRCMMLVNEGAVVQ